MAAPDPLLPSVKAAFMAMRGAAERAFAVHGVHWGQQYLLQALWERDGQTISELAAGRGIEVPTVVRTVQRMEAAGFLRREPDAEDRRRVRIHLTSKGSALEGPITAALGDVDAAAIAGLTKAQQAQLRELLAHLESNLAAE